MTLEELYELVDELLDEHGPDMKVMIANPITFELEELAISMINEFDPDTTSDEDLLVIHADSFDLDEMTEESGDADSD